MQVLVIGDVHACYHTLKALVETYWNPQEMVLVQLGDLINKGRHNAWTINYYWELQRKHPGKVIWLRGNHEHALVKKIQNRPWSENLQRLDTNLSKHAKSLFQLSIHLKNQPLVWENDHVLITHAGYHKKPEKNTDLEHPRSIINNREELKSLPKMQIVGHNVVEGNKPIFSPKENAWRIDTGAYAKKYLSALLIDENGKTSVIRQAVNPADQIASN